MNKNHLLIFGLLIVALILSFVIAGFAGGSKLSLKDAAYFFFHPQAQDVGRDIIWKIRIPRIALGLLVGAGLACCGAVFQGLLRNPLAEPYTLGISGGAAFGVALGTVLRIGGGWVTFLAFCGSVLSVLAVYSIASKKRFSNSVLILGGVILSFLFSSLVFLIFSIAKAEDVHGVVMWLMGDLSSGRASMKAIPFFIIPGIAALLAFARDLNILTLGEEKAFHLGVNSAQVKKMLFVFASLVTGACVAASGIIGFVGLVVPHFTRKIIGVNHRLLLPASCIVGGAFLILCDALARVIIKPLELPVGVVTGIFGGVFFLVFLLRSKKWRIF